MKNGWTRREILAGFAASSVTLVTSNFQKSFAQTMQASNPDATRNSSTPIDRHAVVSRHNIDWPELAGLIPLGNGNFAFNADGTGLETFAGNTMSHWCWHHYPLPDGVTEDDIKPWAALESGRLKGPTTSPPLQKAWLTRNPHPLNLGRIGFIDNNGQRLRPQDCRMISRHLDLWTGLLTSQFAYKGETVTVKSCVAPHTDIVSTQITSALFEQALLRVLIDFPSPSMVGSVDPLKTSTPPWVGDFENVAGHQTELLVNSDNTALFRRTIDSTRYHVRLWGNQFSVAPASQTHRYQILPSINKTVEINYLFSAAEPDPHQLSATEIQTASADVWMKFWKNGGAIDLSRSADKRWMELERRIVLSQYELAVQSAGDYPPAECGLTGLDDWSGKWHFEMLCWHLAHYALWDRWPLAEKAVGIYQHVLPQAKAIAEHFGYKGALWPKSTGPSGYNDGHPPEMVLLWRQPHALFFAELEYRLHPTDATLNKWKDIVQATAEWMADYPTRDETTGHYILWPTWPANEGHLNLKIKDPTFELAYWHYGIEVAQKWRERLGEKRVTAWDDLLAHLTPLPTDNGRYVYNSARTDTYTTRRFGHLDPIGICGMLPPGPEVDIEIAHRTVLEICGQWNWEALWGWDFPWLAMAAARVGEPHLAIEALLNPAKKNEYDPRGLCMRGSQAYLPGNGGLLYAVAMMAAGWDGAPDRPAPGFPNDGTWTVRWEGLNRAP